VKVPHPVRGHEAHVDCGTCRACCHQTVVVSEGEYGYETDTIPTPFGVLEILKQKPDGSCIYLTEAGCGIYHNRPACCRVFDCGNWFATMPTGQLQYMRREAKSHEKRMLQEGKKRASTARR
jgi:Fe-S-cluster containining protein